MSDDRIASETRPWLTADRLTFGYGADPIFENLSFGVASRMVALQGPSGSGKTTLLKLINDDLAPTSGTVRHGGRHAILILQDDSLLPWLTGEGNLAISTTFVPDRIRDRNLVASMSSFIGRRAHQMSFGQRRFIEIVRALGSEADVLLFDEPLNFLDADRRAAVIAELMRQAEDRRVLMSTHYIEDFDGAPVGRLQLAGTPPFREVVTR